MTLAAVIGSAVFMVCSLIKSAIGDLVSDEARGLIVRVPHWMLVLAAKRVTPSVRQDLLDEWKSVLYEMADDPALASRPISLFVQQCNYAFGHLRTSAKTDRSFRGGHFGRDLLDSAFRQVVVLSVAVFAVLTIAIPPVVLLLCCIAAGSYVFATGIAVLLYPLGVFAGAGLTMALFFFGGAATKQRDKTRRVQQEILAARRAEEHAATPEPVQAFVVPGAVRVLYRQAPLALIDESPLVRPFVRHLAGLNPQVDGTWKH